ncbi:hypothetical protein RJD24_09840 [Bacillaceae bacterium IKA-2]|nr:hypothetical protein RJD24_09840 [Bacillaceae bacterium IKA-2]
MVTLGSMIIATFLLLLSLVIDMLLYGVSFSKALKMIFDADESIGSNYLIFAFIFGLIFAITVDYRRRKPQ